MQLRAYSLTRAGAGHPRAHLFYFILRCVVYLSVFSSSGVYSAALAQLIFIVRSTGRTAIIWPSQDGKKSQGATVDPTAS